MSDQDENEKPIEVVFMPGCFDNFEGSQEELDEMIQHIKDMAKSGELFEKSTSVIFEDIEDLIDETDPLEIEQIVNEMLTPRNLQ
jgi:superfamily II helicase